MYINKDSLVTWENIYNIISEKSMIQKFIEYYHNCNTNNC